MQEERDATDAGTVGHLPRRGSTVRRFVLQADSAPPLKQRFSDVAARISRQLDGTYLLAYCSPKRMGMHTLSLNVSKRVSPNSTGYEFPFSADGFGPGCDTQYFEEVCNSKKCGGFNCGACDDETEVCTSDDQCESACIKQNACGGQTITNGFGYAADLQRRPEREAVQWQLRGRVRGRAELRRLRQSVRRRPRRARLACECPQAAQTSCPNGCFDLFERLENCGVCGNYCPSGVQCVAGMCDCGNGHDRLLRELRRLYDQSKQLRHVRQPLPVRATCSGAACICSDSTLTACGTTCANTKTDPKNCGKCGTTCASSQVCSAGKCAACTEVALPTSSTFTYNGTVTGNESRAAACSSGAAGTSFSWSPQPGRYTVTLSGTGISGEIYQSCGAASASYCLGSKIPAVVTVNQANSGLVIFVRNDLEAGGSPNFTLSVSSP